MHKIFRARVCVCKTNRSCNELLTRYVLMQWNDVATKHAVTAPDTGTVQTRALCLVRTVTLKLSN
jgi:hypothetical protein